VFSFPLLALLHAFTVVYIKGENIYGIPSISHLPNPAYSDLKRPILKKNSQKNMRMCIFAQDEGTKG